MILARLGQAFESGRDVDGLTAPPESDRRPTPRPDGRGCRIALTFAKRTPSVAAASQSRSGCGTRSVGERAGPRPSQGHGSRVQRPPEVVNVFDDGETVVGRSDRQNGKRPLPFQSNRPDWRMPLHGQTEADQDREFIA